EVPHLELEAGDVHGQRITPVVEAVPVQAAMQPVRQRSEKATRLLQPKAVMARVTLRQVFQPEVIVEMQVKQGAIHVEQHRVDGLPVDSSHVLSRYNAGTL